MRLAGELDKAGEALQGSRDYCEKVRDYVSKNLFESLLTDEEGHVDFLETQLDLYDRIGAENWGQLNALPANEVES